MRRAKDVKFNRGAQRALTSTQDCLGGVGELEVVLAILANEVINMHKQWYLSVKRTFWVPVGSTLVDHTEGAFLHDVDH